ncbi:endonuclease III [archaeon]|nr:endonuclease III [archaeon]
MTINEFIKALKKRYGVFPMSDPFQVLIFTILSQRTKDSNTTEATARLFSKYKTPEQIAEAPLKEIELLIKPAGFYKVKSKYVKNASRCVAREGMPDTLDALLALPGVGRKTANCVLVYGYNKPAIPVDVHVHRISNRLGFVNTKTPEQTEQELMRLIPKNKWILVNSLLVKFGQELCSAKPRCSHCPIAKKCSYPDKR